MIVLVSFLVTGQGCYEGWDYNAGPGDGPIDPGLPEPDDKPFFFVLFEVIKMNNEAINSDNCFADVSIRSYRQVEWGLRIAAALTALSGIAENVYQVTRDVPPSDCQSLNVVAAAAIDPDPWPQGFPPVDELDRKGLHLRFVLYHDDPAKTPPSTVVADAWSGFETYLDSGRPGHSLLYEVISGTDNGYFETWFDLALPDGLSGTPINSVDPTEAGQTARQNTINSDMAELTQWLLGYQ